MTELNLLYGGDNLLSDNSVIERKDNANSNANSGSNAYSKISSQQLHQMALSNDNGVGDSQQHSPPPPQSQSMQIAQQQMAQQMANQQAQQMAQQQIQQQMMPSQQQQQNEQYRRKPEYNFIDRMNLKKTEVIKLALFSLVIVLGISIDRMLTYYLSRYINDNVLTDFQELLLRLSYPITIFLLLWIFKAI
jgi:hypothetical protein